MNKPAIVKEKFKIYFLSQLSPGDRFYFHGDKKKNIFTLNDQIPFERQLQKGFWKDYANCRPDRVIPGKLRVERHLSNRKVIFLRNINDKA